MEELRRLADQYYKNTVRARFFGVKGWVCIMLSIPFLLLSFSASLKSQDDKVMMLFSLASALFWYMARSEYNRNLIRHLSFYSMIESEDVSQHKAAYLNVITSHVAPSIFGAMKVFKEIIETNDKYSGFVLDNVGYRFSRFLYDHEAKNRILSLFIYLISLIALLTVAKSDQLYAYELIRHINMQDILCYLSLGILFAITGYFSIVVPLMFLWTFFVNPILLRFSFADITLRFFISELNRYSYLEKRIIIR
ncbi:MAG: hypothetical protein ACTFAK_11890 [Candidatus Electronema sp. VV]